MRLNGGGTALSCDNLSDSGAMDMLFKFFTLDNPSVSQLNWLEKAKWKAFCQMELANIRRKG